MLKVWGRKNSSNVKKVLWCLKELQAPYEQIDVGGPFGGLHEANYLALNPNASIPTLQDDDFALWESNTIIRYLCTKYENYHLYPTDVKQRANVEKWMDWSNGSLFFSNPTNDDKSCSHTKRAARSTACTEPKSEIKPTDQNCR